MFHLAHIFRTSVNPSLATFTQEKKFKRIAQQDSKNGTPLYRNWIWTTRVLGSRLSRRWTSPSKPPCHGGKVHHFFFLFQVLSNWTPILHEEHCLLLDGWGKNFLNCLVLKDHQQQHKQSMTRIHSLSCYTFDTHMCERENANKCITHDLTRCSSLSLLPCLNTSLTDIGMVDR